MDESSWQRIRSVGSTIAASFGTFGFFAIQGILLARLLGPEGRGAFATVVAYPQAFLFMGLLGSADIFARMAANLDATDADVTVRRAAMRYGLATGTLTATVCVLLAWFALPAEKQHLAPLASLAALTVPLQHIRLAVQGVDHGRGYFYRFSSVRTAAAAMFPAMLFVMWLADWNELTEVTWALLISCLAGLLLCQIGMTGSWIGHTEQTIAASMRNNREFAISQVVTELLDRADVFLILYLGTLLEQGFYTSAIPIASMMTILPHALTLFAFRHGTDLNMTLTSREITQYVLLVLACQIGSGIVLAVIIPYAVPMLYTQAFTGTVMFAWSLLPSNALRGILMTTDGYMRGRGKPMPGIVGRILAMLALLAITVGLRPIYGVWSIPIAMAAAQFVCLIVVIAAVYRTNSNRPD